MKKFLYCTLFILLIFPLVGCDLDLPNNPWFPGTPTPAPGAPFTRLLGGAGLRTWGYDIAANASGIFITGETSGTGSLDGLTVIGDRVAFLAKYDTSGNKKKTIVYYGENNQSTIAYAVTADTSGVYITGGWHDGGAGARAFIVKYDNSGNKLWEEKPIATNTTTPANTSNYGWGIASHSTGVYVVGETVAFTGLGEYPYLHNSFVAKYDANGTMEWTQRIGSNNAHTYAKAIAVDPSGDYVYVTGFTLDDLDGELIGKVDFFVAKYDADDGDELWVKQLGAADADAICHGVAITATSSGIYVICQSTYSDNFDGESCPSLGTQTFMVIYDPSGDNHQTKFLGVGRSNFFVGDLISDSTGVYAVGDCSWQAFVLKYDFSGNEVEIKTLNSLPTSSYGNGIVKTASGIYITGYADGDLDGQTHLGTEDAFITNKLNLQ